jgi:CubicO group peptidase (beta-lactamase class C family)
MMADSALQHAVQVVLDELVADGDEVGVQAAVIKDGALVADAQSGVADPVSGEPVSAGTLFFAGSTAKGILSSLVHALVAAGRLDYDRRLAEVWPEFAAHGKGNVTVRHVLMHQAGVPGLPPELTTEQLCDWDHMCALVAEAAPWWPPGTAFGYHVQTFGFLLGEALQRTTGARLVTLLKETLTEPLAVTDELHFAVPAVLLDRVARQVAPSGPPPPGPAPGSPLARAMPPGAAPDAAFANRRDVLSAQIPSFGTMSARAAAHIYAALLGHIAGTRLLSAEQLAAAAAVAYSGRDQVMEMEVTWSLGYSPYRPGGARSRSGSTFGMVGTNGSAAYADIDTGVAIALMRNRFSPDFTAIARLDDIVADAYPPPANSEERSP